MTGNMATCKNYKSTFLRVAQVSLLFLLSSVNSASINQPVNNDPAEKGDDNVSRPRRQLDTQQFGTVDQLLPFLQPPIKIPLPTGIFPETTIQQYGVASSKICLAFGSRILDYVDSQFKKWQSPTWYSLTGNNPDEPGDEASASKKPRIEMDLSSLVGQMQLPSSSGSANIGTDNDAITNAVRDLYGPRINPEEERNQTKHYNPVCKDNFNNFVDWFVVYKLPKTIEKYNQGHWDEFNSTGGEYVYITSESVKTVKNFIHSEYKINDHINMIAYTLDPIYDIEDRLDIFFAMYNDQPPIGSSRDFHAHSKGVLALGMLTGFWMPHSVPKFPASRSEFEYGSPKNGQTIMCISIMTGLAGKQMLDIIETIKPYIYFSSADLFDNFEDPVPVPGEIISNLGGHLSSFLSEINNRSTPCNSISETIMSIHRMPFDVVAHSRDFNVNIFDHLLYNYEDNFITQTWRRTRTLAPEISLIPPRDNSSNKMVVNICEIGLDYSLEETGVGLFVDYKTLAVRIFRWGYTKDHSKWAVAVEQEIFCAGDLNRDEPQNKRGGSLVCFREKTVAESFRYTVMSIAKFSACKAGRCPTPWSLMFYEELVDVHATFDHWCDRTLQGEMRDGELE
ncbi:plancitoxin-1 isoform X1 [Folsomia candida]|uniref:plancitoxin-1 isoform X1 n=1 Tax=Folsomia candida TaxID=158441 RepID=UPI0016055823|nr:plancitoxin-1 isoform X1 [Folsomia candida]